MRSRKKLSPEAKQSGKEQTHLANRDEKLRNLADSGVRAQARGNMKAVWD